jgi:hypothetical protein
VKGKEILTDIKESLNDKVFIKKDLKNYIPFIKYIPLFNEKKIKVIIINEDQSTNTFYKSLPKSYCLNINKKSYILVTKCILRMDDKPCIFYFYNNPFPIFLEHKVSTYKPINLKSEEELNIMDTKDRLNLASVTIDAESLNLAFNTRFIRGLYFGDGMTTKTMLYIVGAVVIGILLILQLTGQVDVLGSLNGMLTGR